MAIEDTFGYRFVRISLILLNCLVLIRLISLLLQYSPYLEPTHVLVILFIGSNFMAAIIGTIREHRIAVLLTGTVTLVMFLSLLFTQKDNKNLNVSLFTLLAIAAHSLIFSEMLKEKQLFSNQRRNLDILGHLSDTNSSHTSSRRATSNHAPLTAVVVYQPPGTNQGQSGGIFMVDPLIGTDIPKDPPPSYFSGSCPPPKYEDAINLSGSSLILPIFNATPSTTVESTQSVADTGTTSTLNNNNSNNSSTNEQGTNVEQQQISHINSDPDHISSSPSSSSSSASAASSDNTQQQISTPATQTSDSTTTTAPSIDNNNNSIDDNKN